jgi:two-component system sensor histidine kinase TctE
VEAVISLRQRLLTWLLLPLVLVGVVAAGGAYVFVEKRLVASYDQDLSDIAAALAPYIAKRGAELALTFSAETDAVLRSDTTDRILYAASGPNGEFLGGDRGLPSPPETWTGAAPVFWDARLNGERIRVVAHRRVAYGLPVTLVAAETTHKRERAALEAMFSAILPTALLSLAAVGAVIFGVRRGLGPLDRLREEIQARSHLDLSPVAERDVVEELRPVVRELNAMLARLGDAQRTQVRFIANAAHQLRTPIAGLVAQLDLARSGPARDEHIAQARDGAARLARLAQQLLSLAAADPAANPQLEQHPCDLSEIVKDRANAWLRITLSRGVEMEFDLAQAPIQGNAVLVGELATNLVDNAARYGARNVRIATRHWGESSVLEVTDDGPGIPESEREHIFERFRRLDNESTEGSGLGLSIVREIAQRHGATVELTDGPERSGTRIGVLFPASN